MPAPISDPVFLMISLPLLALAVGFGAAWVLAKSSVNKALQDMRDDLLTKRSEAEEARKDTATAREDVASLSAQVEALDGRLDEARAERRALDEQRGKDSAEIQALKVEAQRQKTVIEKERQAHEEKITELNQVRGQIEQDLKVLMNSLLETNSEKFLKTAKKAFEDQQEKGETEIKGLVNPVKEALDKFQQQMGTIEASRKKQEGELAEQLRTITANHTKLSDTTTSLVNALRSAPKTRGKWGEQQLRSILEMAGMLEHTDFETERHISTEDGSLRPDVVLRMPGGRTLVIDAKTSLSAYLDAMEAESEEERELYLHQHAGQVKTHAMQLGKKSYWDALPEKTVDFVVMFVPGEPMYAAAMARLPDLFEEAWEKKVIICSPTTLLGLAKAIAYGWRQEQASREAEKIHQTGTELYKRLVAMGRSLDGLTKSLTTHVNKHNQFIGSLEGTVLPKARQLTQLSVGHSHGEIEQIDSVEKSVREAKRDRDLEFDETALPKQIAANED